MVASQKKDIRIDLRANNLCSLCLTVPELVFPSSPRYSENNSRAVEIFASSPKKYIGDDLGDNNLCSFLLPAIRNTILVGDCRNVCPSTPQIKERGDRS